MKIEFNNGFVTAIALFLEHKNFTSHLPRDKENKLICDLRLYGASDHLFDLETPKSLPGKIKKRINSLRSKAFLHRLDHFEDSKYTDYLFKEAEHILKAIDEQVFKTKKFIMRYR